MKGAPVYKVSRHNKRKAHLRIFFYSPGLEAFCWKSPKDQFPEKKQLVYLKNIREIHTRLEPSRKLPAPFSESQYIRIIMAENGQDDLELICDDPALRNCLLKVINSLLEDMRKSRKDFHTLDGTSLLSGAKGTGEFLVSKYSNDI